MTKKLLQARRARRRPSDEDAFLDRCVAVIDRWSPILGLDTWIINTRVATGGELEDGDKAAVFCYPEYRDAEISLSLRRLEAADDVELEETLIHELCHVRTAEFFWLWKRSKRDQKKLRGELEESLVSDVTGAITRAHQAGVTGTVSRRGR